MILNIRRELLTQISSHHFSLIWQYIQVDMEIYSSSIEEDVFQHSHLNVLPLSFLPIIYRVHHLDISAPRKMTILQPFQNVSKLCQEKALVQLSYVFQSYG